MSLTPLAISEAEGTLGKMKDYWFKDVSNLKKPMPEFSYSGEKGDLNQPRQVLLSPMILWEKMAS